MLEKIEYNLGNDLKRRRRVNRIKTGIIVFVGIWVVVSAVLCATLMIRVMNLENSLREIAENMPRVEEVKNVETQSLPKSDQGESVNYDVDSSAKEDSSSDQSQKKSQKETGEKIKVYLTFDDGPSTNTEEILRILKDYDVKATFFVTGKTDDLSREMYKRIVKEGHTLGMHSYSHKYSVLYESLESFKQDFSQIHDYLYEVTGEDCKYYRFPGGSSNQVCNNSENSMRQYISYLNEQGVTYYDWNVSSGDATSRAYTVDELRQNVMNDVVKYKNSIVLMHDSTVKPTTVEALPTIIEHLKEIGAEILPIDEDTVPIQHVSIETEQ